jgi:hypothetical protein
LCGVATAFQSRMQTYARCFFIDGNDKAAL